MNVNKIIEELNTRNYSGTQGIKGSYLELSEEEKSVIEKYQPQHVLVVYGSLAPGRPNHDKVEHIQGRWRKATIRGKLTAMGWGANLGYYAFVKADPAEEEKIEAYILYSDELTTNWDFLDDFEGDEYERVLTEFTLDNGEVGVGNIYALRK